MNSILGFTLRAYRQVGYIYGSVRDVKVATLVDATVSFLWLDFALTLNPKPLNRLTFNRREGPQGPLDPRIRISTPKMPTVSLSIPDFHLPPALHAKTPQHGVGVGVQQN